MSNVCSSLREGVWRTHTCMRVYPCVQARWWGWWRVLTLTPAQRLRLLSRPLLVRALGFGLILAATATTASAHLLAAPIAVAATAAAGAAAARTVGHQHGRHSHRRTHRRSHASLDLHWFGWGVVCWVEG